MIEGNLDKINNIKLNVVNFVGSSDYKEKYN